MLYSEFKFAYETGHLNYLVSVPKALRLMLTYKSQDRRFRIFLLQLLGSSAGVIAAGGCAFILLPPFWPAAGLVVASCLITLWLWFETGNLLLQLALEDDQFFEIVTNNDALAVSPDTEVPSLAVTATRRHRLRRLRSHGSPVAVKTPRGL